MTTETFTVRVSDAAGNETVGTKTFQVGGGAFDQIVTTPSLNIIVLAGEHWHLRGPALGGPAVFTLTADLHNRGMLSADPDVTVDGQGLFDMHAHGGGIFDLQGTPKTGWCRWGDPVSGWKTGDRLTVSATAAGKVSPVNTVWGGSWAATSRPADSPDVVLHGEVMRPEVSNLTRSLTIRNVTRLMMHDSGGVPNVHTLKHFAMPGCGLLAVGFYPIHFHLLGDSARGSLVEGVVVEDAKFRSFVPHGSHGVTFRDCVAKSSGAEGFWWDLPDAVGPNGEPQANNSDDTVYDHCLVQGVSNFQPPGTPTQAIGTAFMLGNGDRNRITDSAACGVYGGLNGSGAHWSERSAGSVWIAERFVTHNNQKMGTHTWQNSESIHRVVDFKAYHNGVADINHGAYTNHYQYLGARCGVFALHALSFREALQPLTIDDLVCDFFDVKKHNIAGQRVVVSNSQLGRVRYKEIGSHRSIIEYRDCGLTPADFSLVGTGLAINPASVIEVFQGGVLRHRWASGVWT